MVRNYKYGFEYRGFTFGWFKKELYRLPSIVHLRSYPIRKLNKIKVGNKDGYRVVRDRLTVDQLMEMTEVIDFTHTINGMGSENCPF